MADTGRPGDNLYEVALWEDLVTVQGEAFYAYMVDNRAIVIRETIDSIRTLTGRARRRFHREDQRRARHRMLFA